MPRPIALALATGRPSLRELQEFYSVEDCWDMAEVAAVENYNVSLLNEEQARRNANR